MTAIVRLHVRRPESLRRPVDVLVDEVQQEVALLRRERIAHGDPLLEVD